MTPPLGWRARLKRLWPAFVIPAVIATTVGSDFFGLPGFWRDHAITAGLVSGLALLLITLAVVDAIVESRELRRWNTAAMLGFRTFSGSIETAFDDLSFAFTGCRPRFITYEPAWPEARSQELVPERIAGRVDAASVTALFEDRDRRRAVEGALVALRIRHRRSLAVWLPTFVAVGRLAATAEQLARFNGRLAGIQHAFVLARDLRPGDDEHLAHIVDTCLDLVAEAVDDGLSLQRDLMADAGATWWHAERRHLHVFGRPDPLAA